MPASKGRRGLEEGCERRRGSWKGESRQGEVASTADERTRTCTNIRPRTGANEHPQTAGPTSADGDAQSTEGTRVRQPGAAACAPPFFNFFFHVLLLTTLFQ